MRDDILLDEIAPKLGLSVKMAYKRAGMNRLPFPTYRFGSRKSKRYVDAQEWESYLEAVKGSCREEWMQSQTT